MRKRRQREREKDDPRLSALEEKKADAGMVEVRVKVPRRDVQAIHYHAQRVGGVIL